MTGSCRSDVCVKAVKDPRKTVHIRVYEYLVYSVMRHHVRYLAQYLWGTRQYRKLAYNYPE